ncbi:MAG: hypothetical protein LBG65_04560 [Puniceicoccales bacterium]|jgi:TolB protein|nr:hypothetical protein [Puniceicoccales bacterium]
MRPFSFLPAIAAAVLACATPAALPAQSAPGGPIRIVGTVRRQAITVESADSELNNLARRAFKAHGNYDLVAGADTRLSLVKTGANSVRGDFTSKRRGIRSSQAFTGASWQEAALRACDDALERDGQRPFFSGKLAFVSDRTGSKEVYAGDLFLSVATPLTNYRSVVLSPRWTHTGTEVLHTTYVNGNFTDIYAVDVRDPRRRRGVVVGARGTTTGAVSNPRTGRLAFTSSARGDMDIFGADASGGGARLLVRTPKNNVETDPAWSADGTLLAYVSGASGRPSLHVSNADGSAPRRLPTAGIRYATEPAWNPVFKTKIAFTYQEGGVFALAVLDTATSKVTRLEVRGAQNHTHPIWCADGRHLIATQTSGRASRLVLVDTLTGLPGLDGADVNPSDRRVTVLSNAGWANCYEADYRAPAR